MNYVEVNTKHDYRNLLQNMIEQTIEMIKRFPEIKMYTSILLQLEDIQKNILAGKLFDLDEVFNRYTLGGIASKNFDCERDLYGRRLQDVFGGLIDFPRMPEN